MQRLGGYVAPLAARFGGDPRLHHHRMRRQPPLLLSVVAPEERYWAEPVLLYTVVGGQTVPTSQIHVPKPLLVVVDVQPGEEAAEVESFY